MSAHDHDHDHDHDHAHSNAPPHDHRQGGSRRHHLHAYDDRERYEDPTHTRTLQDAYARRLRGGFGNITTVIREWVEEDDGLELTARGTTPDELIAEPSHPAFDFSTDGEKIDGFEEWLREAVDSEVLEIVAEVLTTGDRRRCDICESRHRQRMTIDEARGGAGPIYHPNCRCTVRSRIVT